MAQSLPMDQRPGLFVITGAGRGLGRAIALALAAKAAAGSRFVLIGRCAEALAAVAMEISQLRPGEGGVGDLEAQLVTLDLGLADSSAISAAFAACSPPAAADGAASFGLLVHNAGSLGAFGCNSDSLDDKAALDEHWSLNVTSVLLLNAYWLRQCSSMSWWLVNVSSLCALQPFKTLAMYCSAKAARLMMFRTLALERPDLTILSFGPGPLDTDMQAQLRDATQDAEMRAMWRDLRPRLLTAGQSATVLLRLLMRGGYSGDAQVDIYDVMDELLKNPDSAVEPGSFSD